jgi:hypothetical protein
MVDTPTSVFDHTCGHELDPAMVCRHCGGEVEPGDLTVRVLTPGWTRQGPATVPDAAGTATA